MIKRAKHSPKDNAGKKSLVESTILTGKSRRCIFILFRFILFKNYFWKTLHLLLLWLNIPICSAIYFDPLSTSFIKGLYYKISYPHVCLLHILHAYLNTNQFYKCIVINQVQIKLPMLAKVEYILTWKMIWYCGNIIGMQYEHFDNEKWWTDSLTACLFWYLMIIFVVRGNIFPILFSSKTTCRLCAQTHCPPPGWRFLSCQCAVAVDMTNWFSHYSIYIVICNDYKWESICGLVSIFCIIHP